MDEHINEEDEAFILRLYQFEPQISPHVQDIPSDDESSNESDSTDYACSEDSPG
jgi:Mn-dependent DtxR family transcriptional regulator